MKPVSTIEVDLERIISDNGIFLNLGSKETLPSFFAALPGDLRQGAAALRYPKMK
jgi:hypothetical protein